MDLLDEIERRVICADGAMGTLLMERGVSNTRCFEEVCVSDPDLVTAIHDDYIAAGAEIIGTNSFASNAHRLARFGFEGRVNEINWQAAQLAKQAARGKALVAGCIAPTGMTAEEADARGIDRDELLREQMGALLDGGAQLISLETFQDVDELLLAIRIKQELHHCPVIASLAVNESGLLPSGESLSAAFARLADGGADIVAINCIAGPNAALRLATGLPAEPPFAVSPNAGRPRFLEGRYHYDLTPGYFAEVGVEIAAQGARIVGGCCGTTPAHIAALAPALKALKAVTSKVSFAAPREAEPVTEGGSKSPNLLDMVAAGRTVILTELDPPKSLSLEKYFIGARALTEAGSDWITLADNSLAILRVSNLAVGARLKALGVEPLLHISCRDRNVLGLQSELMGMAALGIDHVLPLTGDPAKVGDHPGAKSVYDVTSIQLLEIVRRLNEGFTQSGTDLKRSPGLVAGCTFNPNAKNLDAQIARLERKLAAGAKYVMTQPVFDTGLVEETARRTQAFGVPVFVGVWPLLNGRQAAFLHNEVPGITIPDAVQEAMRGKEGAEGRAAGVARAKDVAACVLDHFPGIYLITPFTVFETTVELAGFVRSR